jgi:large subunit ribosomal protein L24
MGQARKRNDTATFKAHVKKGDEVVVRAGRSYGGSLERADRGRVISVDPQRERAIVEGVNLITKHQKPQGGQTPAAAARQQSGRIEKAAPIHLSNLMVVCPSCGKPTRVGHKQTRRARSAPARSAARRWTAWKSSFVWMYGWMGEIPLPVHPHTRTPTHERRQVSNLPRLGAVRWHG